LEGQTRQEYIRDPESKESEANRDPACKARA